MLQVLDGILWESGEGLLWAFFLVLLRTVAFVWLSPWLAHRALGWPQRVVVSLVLAAALTPLVVGVSRAADFSNAISALSPLPLFLLALRELTMGACFALAVAVPLHAMSWSGMLMERVSGLDGGRRLSEGGLSRLYSWTALALFFVLGAHRVALRAFAQSLSLAAPTSLPAELPSVDLPIGLILPTAQLLTAAFTISVSIAAPVLLSTLLIEALLGLYSRVAPRIGSEQLSMPLTTSIALLAALAGLTALLPELGSLFARSIASATELF